ncbi:MAG: TRAP transporter small permease [Siculibacillus sp.]|nr:TRAP transporter small permease [Siculibacillus sp.]
MVQIRPSSSTGLDLLARAALWAAGAALVLMTIIVGAQVFSRYVLNFSLTWVEPLAIQLMGWFIFLGAAVGVRENFHLGLDLLRYLAPPRVNRVMDAISMVVIAIFGLFISWYGLQLAIRTWDTTISGLGISGAWDFVPLMSSGVLITVFALERLWRDGVQGEAMARSVAVETEATPESEVA